MKVVVSTSHSILCVDLKTGVFFPLHRGCGLYYGITTNNSMFMVGARNRLVSSCESPDHEQGEILVFDKNFEILSSVKPDSFLLRDIHDISWSDDCLWVTCSYDNMIAIWNGSDWKQWYPLGREDCEPLDKNHFNTFFFDCDFIWIVAHNKGPSELLKFNKKSLRLESRAFLGYQAHNLWRENGGMYTCSSGEGAIVGTNGFRVETGGFPRGVAFGHGLRCVGISELAERNNRDLTNAKIALFDNSWAYISEIELPNEGLILDIKFLD